MTDAESPSPESLRLELQEAITTFRHQWAQLLQGLGILVSADAILLGYGFAQKLSSVLLVASLMPLAALSGYITSMTALVPVCYVAIRLEEKLSLEDVPFVGTWVKPRGDLPAAISDFARLANSESQNSTLKVPVSHFLKNLTSRTILVAFVLQIALVVISILGYHFRFM
jgi:hypothetical protein